jgi:hypothetical protein
MLQRTLARVCRPVVCTTTYGHDLHHARGGSGLTQEVKSVVARDVRADNGLQAEASGQLPDLG